MGTAFRTKLGIQLYKKNGGRDGQHDRITEQNTELNHIDRRNFYSLGREERGLLNGLFKPSYLLCDQERIGLKRGKKRYLASVKCKTENVAQKNAVCQATKGFRESIGTKEDQT